MSFKELAMIRAHKAANLKALCTCFRGQLIANEDCGALNFYIGLRPLRCTSTFGIFVIWLSRDGKPLSKSSCIFSPTNLRLSFTVDSACIDCRPGYGIADIERCTVVGDDSIPHIDAPLEYTFNWCAHNRDDSLASELLVGLVGSEVDCPSQVSVRHAGR